MPAEYHPLCNGVPLRHLSPQFALAAAITKSTLLRGRGCSTEATGLERGDPTGAASPFRRTGGEPRQRGIDQTGIPLLVY